MHASAAELAGFCDRLAMSLDAGIDLRRVLHGEAERSSGRRRTVCEQLSRAVDAGKPLDEAIDACADYFPRLVVEMFRVGERTGRLPEVLKRLARHYEHRVAMRRSLMRQIAWPLMQLVLALLVCVTLIAIGGVLSGPRGGNLDLLGFGLTGSQGVWWFLLGITGGVVAVALLWRSLRERPSQMRLLTGFATRLPVVGQALRKLALERVAWTLALLLDSEIDLRRVGRLALSATGNVVYERHTKAVLADIERGMPLSNALGQTGEFPGEFLDSLAVAEESGQLVESLRKLSDRYEDEARRAVAVLTGVLGALIWLGIAALIITLVFRVFGFYKGVLQDALDAI